MATDISPEVLENLFRSHAVDSDPKIQEMGRQKLRAALGSYLKELGVAAKKRFNMGDSHLCHNTVPKIARRLGCEPTHDAILVH